MSKIIPELMFRGGIAHDVTRIYITKNALDQFEELFPHDNIGDILSEIRQVKRFADNSGYFIYIKDDMRFVFCVDKGRELSEGRFTLTRVQLQYKRN